MDPRLCRDERRFSQPCLPPVRDDPAVAHLDHLAGGEAAEALEEGAGAEGIVEIEKFAGRLRDGMPAPDWMSRSNHWSRRRSTWQRSAPIP